MRSLQARARKIHQRLLGHYGRLGWKERSQPLDELIRTILSQNTNDGNRDRAYSELQARFPTWEAVRDADERLVIEAISSAGLANQKGPRIQRLLHQVTEERGDLNLEFLRRLPPEDVYPWLRRFKGVGPKTAAIVMLFSFDMPAFPVDTHIYRVAGRLGLRPEGTSAERAQAMLAGLFPPDSYKVVHLGLIQHGREVCRARHPSCNRCLLQDLCDYSRAWSTTNRTG